MVKKTKGLNLIIVAAIALSLIVLIVYCIRSSSVKEGKTERQIIKLKKKLKIANNIVDKAIKQRDMAKTALKKAHNAYYVRRKYRAATALENADNIPMDKAAIEPNSIAAVELNSIAATVQNPYNVRIDGAATEQKYREDVSSSMNLNVDQIDIQS